MADHEDRAFRQTQIALFRASALKRAKWRALSRFAGPVTGIDALDLGADNGVISWLLRRDGGRWTSADLTEETVNAISRMVSDRVHRIADANLPFSDGSFDLVVVVDMLEHVHDDRAARRDRADPPAGRTDRAESAGSQRAHPARQAAPGARTDA